MNMWLPSRKLKNTNSLGLRKVRTAKHSKNPTHYDEEKEEEKERERERERSVYDEEQRNRAQKRKEWESVYKVRRKEHVEMGDENTLRTTPIYNATTHCTTRMQRRRLEGCRI